jgi:dihydroxy-acid dehydratase
VIGHVSPEAYLGGPIALIEDGDRIVVDINNGRLDCLELNDADTFTRRSTAWNNAVASNGGVHPVVKPVTNRLLRRMRATARPPLEGGGMAVD